MNIVVACEYSGVVRDAFIARGHNAISCDLLPTDAPGPHYQGDIFELLAHIWRHGRRIDLMIAHPPCTYLCSSGLHWNARRPERAAQTEDAVRFATTLFNLDIERIALENPIGCLSKRIRKPDQIIHPHQFGHDASKATCLWLKKLSKLQPTCLIPPRTVGTHKRWANQTNSGQNKLGPSADRWKLRSETYLGIAQAMAAQWG